MIPFIGAHYPDKSRASSSSRLINCYTETSADPNAKSPFKAIGTEGTSVWADLGKLGDIRGSRVTDNGVLYGVYGSSLVKINSDKTFEVVSDVGNLSTFVSMADNGYYLMIADTVNLWAFNLSTKVLQEVTPDDFKNPTYVSYMNQRFVAINNDPTKKFGVDQVPNNNKVFFSEAGSSGCLEWREASFFSSESSADANIAMEVVGNSLWVWGQRSYEIYQSTTNPNAPFSRIGGASGEIGCLAPNSVSKIGGSVFWLGSSSAGNNQIYMSQGLSGIKTISDPSISYQLDEMGDTSDAVSYTHQRDGHNFYTITFIGGNKTYRYDTRESNWARLTTREQFTNVENRSAILFAVGVYSTILCGISSTENVGSLVIELDPNKYDDWDGRPIVRTVQGPHMWSDLKRVNMKKLELDMQIGIIPQTGQGSKPSVEIAISQNGYKFDYVRNVPLPLTGRYSGRVSIPRLGQATSPVIRIKQSDPIPFSLNGVRLDTEVINGN